MGRGSRRSKDDPSVVGVMSVDKPSGLTSHDVVDRVRRRLGVRRVGHAGTLDPMATGVLIIGVGPSTRLLRNHRRARQGIHGNYSTGCIDDDRRSRRRRDRAGDHAGHPARHRRCDRRNRFTLRGCAGAATECGERGQGGRQTRVSAGAGRGRVRPSGQAVTSRSLRSSIFVATTVLPTLLAPQRSMLMCGFDARGTLPARSLAMSVRNLVGGYVTELRRTLGDGRRHRVRRPRWR